MFYKCLRFYHHGNARYLLIIYFSHWKIWCKFVHPAANCIYEKIIHLYVEEIIIFKFFPVVLKVSCYNYHIVMATVGNGHVDQTSKLFMSFVDRKQTVFTNSDGKPQHQ